MREDRRSDERKRAEQMYLESGGKRKLVDIAVALQLPDLKIRKWKSLDKWDSKLALHDSPPKMERSLGKPKGKKGERSTQKKKATIALDTGVKRKRGGQKGNKNAVGGRGNPDPRKNGLKHGVYADPFWGCLMEGEEAIVEQTPIELEDLYREQIRMFRVREYRIMSRIKELKEGQKIIIESVTKDEEKRSFESEEDELAYKAAIMEKIENRDYTCELPPMHPRCMCAVEYREEGDTSTEKPEEPNAIEPQQTDVEAPEDSSEYEDITEDWIEQHRTGTPMVYEAQSYQDKDGTVYKVDGINVKQEHTEHEKSVGSLLSRATHEPVLLVPEVKGAYKNVHTPDFLLGTQRERWDLKDITKDGKDSIRNAAHKKKEQTDNFVFNVSGEAVQEHVVEQAKKAFSQYNMTFVKKIAVIRDDKIICVMRRK